MFSQKINRNGTKLSLKSNFSWNFLGNLVFAIGQWSILAILTRMIAVEYVGNYSYAVAFSAPIVLFFEMQLRALQVTDVNEEYTFGDYFGLRIVSSILCLIVVFLLSLYTRSSYQIILLISSVTLMKLIDSIADILYGVFQKEERMNFIAISRIIKGITIVISFSITLWYSRNIVVSILAVTFMKGIVVVFYDLNKVRLSENITPSFDSVNFRELFISSLPLGVMSMLTSLDANIPKYVIEHFEGFDSLGYYSALSYINIAGGQMITAVSQAATPRLSKLYNMKDKNPFKVLLLKLTLIGFLLGLISVLFIVLFGRQFITILYGSSYAQYMNVFIVMMFAGAINYTSSFLGNAMTAARAFKIQPFLGIIWVVTSLVFSVLLIPDFGLMGAAIALVISALIKLISKLVVVHMLIYDK